MEETVQIKAGQQMLHGILHMPSTEKQVKGPVMVICHGFIGNKVGQHRMFIKAARAISACGLAVLRFDFSGCGESTGEYRDVTLTQQIQELKCVIEYVVSHPLLDADNIILLGHSMGGCIASVVAGAEQRVRKLVLWSPVARPLVDLVGIVGHQLFQVSKEGNIVSYQGFELGPAFFESLGKHDPLEAIQHFAGDVYIVHGGKDIETPLENLYLYEKQLQQRRRGTLACKVIDHADHTYNDPEWEQELITATLNWLSSEK